MDQDSVNTCDLCLVQPSEYWVDIGALCKECFESIPANVYEIECEHL